MTLGSDDGIDSGDLPAVDGFVSYKREEIEAVRRLLEPLIESPQSRHFWIDRQDIESGADWRERIDKGIASSTSFIFMMSPASLTSRECLQELDTAIRFGKRVIPVHLMGNLAAVQLPAELQSRQWIDATADVPDAASRISEAIDLDIEFVDAHSTLLSQALDWSRSGNRRSDLLRGKRLVVARRMIEGASVDDQPRIVGLQTKFVATSVAAKKQRRFATGGTIVVVAVIVVLAVGAWVQRNRARDAERVAASLRQASDSGLLLEEQLDLGILVALTGLEVDDNVRSRSAAINALTAGRGVRIIARTGVETAEAQLSGEGLIVVMVDPSRVATARSVSAVETSAESLGAAGTAAISWDGSSIVTADGEAVVHRTAQVPAGVRCSVAGTATETAVSSSRAAVVTRVGNGSQVWLLDDGCADVPILEESAPVTVLAFDRSGAHLGIGTADGLVAIWSVELAGRLQSLIPAEASIVSMRFSPDGRWLAAGLGSGQIALWKMDDLGKQPTLIAGPRGNQVMALDFSEDGRRLVAGDQDGFVQVYDLADVSAIDRAMISHPEDRQSSAVVDIRFGPGDGTAVSVHADGRIISWDVVDRSPLWARTNVRGAARDTSAVPGGILTATSTGVWMTRTSEDGPSELLWSGDSSAVAVDEPTGRLLIGTPAGDVIVVDDQDREYQLQAHDGEVTAVAWAMGGQVIVTVGTDGRLLITDMISGKTVERSHQSGYIADVEPMPNGLEVVTVGFDRVVRLWSVADGEERASFPGHTGSVDSVAVNPSGTLIASGSDDRSILIWDVATETIVDRLIGHADRVVAVTFSGDGTRIASGSEDRAVIVWDLAESVIVGQPLVDQFESQPQAVAFSPGRVDRVFSASDGLAVWDLGLDELLEEGCAIAAGRAVNEAELKRYFGGLEPYQC